MSTIAEIEKAVPQLSAEELAELEQFIREAREGARAQTEPAGYGAGERVAGFSSRWERAASGMMRCGRGAPDDVGLTPGLPESMLSA